MMDFSLSTEKPSVYILNDHIPLATTDTTLILKFAAKSDATPLDRIHLFHNDVPVYGRNGLQISSPAGSSSQETVELSLLPGENNFTIMAEDQKGVKSREVSAVVFSEPPASGSDLYFIGIGVSKFRDSTLNLQYAEKDAADLATIISDHEYGNGRIFTHTLTNKQVTKTGIFRLKQILAGTKERDKVIIYVATHGVISEDFQYYLATYDTHFSGQTNYGISYREIENLLDGIPARRKLLLIDACHSGEFDKAAIQLIKDKETLNGKVTMRSLNDLPVPKPLDEDDTFELMKSLFLDLRRGTGTTVIASAGSAEFAFEGDKWKNGVFAYCLKQAIVNLEADLDQDGKIMVSELQRYLNSEVKNLTDGAQRPGIRIENISNDWAIF